MIALMVFQLDAVAYIRSVVDIVVCRMLLTKLLCCQTKQNRTNGVDRLDECHSLQLQATIEDGRKSRFKKKRYYLGVVPKYACVIKIHLEKFIAIMIISSG